MTSSLDIHMLRKTLVREHNTSLALMDARRKSDGSIAKDDLIAYTVHAAEVAILGKIIHAIDDCRVYDSTH